MNANNPLIPKRLETVKDICRLVSQEILLNGLMFKILPDTGDTVIFSVMRDNQQVGLFVVYDNLSIGHDPLEWDSGFMACVKQIRSRIRENQDYFKRVDREKDREKRVRKWQSEFTQPKKKSLTKDMGDDKGEKNYPSLQRNDAEIKYVHAVMTETIDSKCYAKEAAFHLPSWEKRQGAVTRK